MDKKNNHQHITKSVSETQKLAEQLAKQILKSKSSKKAVVLALEGDLGGGKTTFIQGFARGLGIKEKILSPTFVILKRFKITSNKQTHTRASRIRGGQTTSNKNIGFENFYHIDCYRIKKTKELLVIGFKEIILNPQNIVSIEWSDRVSPIIPKSAIKLKFNFINKNTRKINIRE